MKIILLIILLILTFFNYSQSFLKVGEVYDFEIGDEFHYELPYAPSNADRVVITNKTFSNNLDTVCYERSHSKYTSTYPPVSYSFASYIDNVCYTYLDSLIVNLNFISPDSNYMFYDTLVYFDTNSYCNNEINGYSYAGEGIEPYLYSKIWGKGLGLLVDHFSQPGDPSVSPYETRLFYYNKGSFICGTPDYTEIMTLEFEELKVFPNPVKSLLNISIGNEIIKELKVVNSVGEVVLIKKVGALSIQLELNDWPIGIYFLDVKSKSRTLKEKILKI